MKRILLFLLFVFTCLNNAFAQVQYSEYALTDVHVVDVVNNSILEHKTVLVKDGLISAITNTSSGSLPDSIIQIKMSGKYVMPGLIDTHVHFGTDPTEIDNRETTERVLKNMLLSGITSVRDMAGDARALADISRDALVGDIPSPFIYYSSLMAGPKFFEDPRTISSAKGLVSGEAPFMKAVTKETDLKLAVAEAKGTGATGIKTYAMISGDLEQAIVEEAHKQGMMVWSHINLGDASKEDVIKAGADVVSHIGMIIDFSKIRENNSWSEYLDHNETFWDDYYTSLKLDSYLDLLESSNTIFEPTTLVYQRRRDAQLDKKEPSTFALGYGNIVLEVTKRFLPEAHKRGIKIAAGTDTDQEIFVQKEIYTFVDEYGFSPAEALQTATINAAQAIGREESTGTVEIGKAADLLILNSNPLQDIRNIEDISLVVKKGAFFK